MNHITKLRIFGQVKMLYVAIILMKGKMHIYHGALDIHLHDIITSSHLCIIPDG